VNTAPQSGSTAQRASLALDNLRGFVILLVLSFHSVLAYLNFLPASPFLFDTPPYLWRAFPIVDTARWFGFDLFCAWQDVFLMSMFFFLSGLFVWRSLERKATRISLHDRIEGKRETEPDVVALLMPLAISAPPQWGANRWRATAAKSATSRPRRVPASMPFGAIGSHCPRGGIGGAAEGAHRRHDTGMNRLGADLVLRVLHRDRFGIEPSD
jgi:hypothetical protein